ncbi:MAG: transporter [Deltaproteobacteria bacterium]|nr:transporter [Deltaproteobacteria bacterium]MBW2053891.1 transporter [Deltaproteobacteria bacterium]MBW2142557.1 transporter [Deltaproteobacteria bacterium]
MRGNWYLKSTLMGWLAAAMLLGGAAASEPGELGHYMPGVASVRDFAVPAAPGFYYAQYNLYYNTDAYKDRNGNPVNSVTIGPVTFNIDARVEAYAIQPTFIWVSPWKLLGASYSAFIGVPITSTSVQAALSTETRFGLRVDEGQRGLGDLYVRPLWFGWNLKNFGISVGYGFYAPTGRHVDGEVDNTGLGFWTHEFQAGVTWYPWESQATAVMLAGTYEIHQQKDGVDITPGNRFSLDYGISQFIPTNEAGTLLLELGVSGYSQWQVDSDSGADVLAALNVKDQIHGIGAQIGLAYVPWNASIVFRFLTEYNAEARFEGNLFTLTFSKGF